MQMVFDLAVVVRIDGEVSVTLIRTVKNIIIALECHVLTDSLLKQILVTADTGLTAGIQQTKTQRRMSEITGNLDCSECLSSAHVANCTELPRSSVDEDDELLRYIWREYLHPKQYEWVLIVAYIIVFFVSLIGNSLGKLHL